MTQKYSINGATINFDVDKYLAKSLDISREKMPQINMEKLKSVMPMFKKHVKIFELMLPIEVLSPTQNEINFEKCLMRCAANPSVDDDLEFVCSRDLHIMDGHHTHVKNLMINPKAKAKCYIFDAGTEELLELFSAYKELLNKSKSIDESLQLIDESYGAQGPEAVPGMGSVEYPTVSQSGEMPAQDGSGDIMGLMKFYDRDDDEVWNSFEETLKFADKLLVRKDERENFVNQIKKRFVTEDQDENKNLQLETHFNSIDDLPKDKLKTCFNLPIERQCMKVDTEFSCGTLEGITQGKAGDYVMVGADKEIYPCDNDIFHKTYQLKEEEVEEQKEQIDENQVKGGLADGMTLQDLAIKHAYDDSSDSLTKTAYEAMLKQLKDELEKGLKIEMEHTNDESTAREIAMDHLYEMPDYYTKLAKMENESSKTLE